MTDSCCGTGVFGEFSFPGDPSNFGSIHATGVNDGIEVQWQLPQVNPHAVAFTRLFRSEVNDVNTAIEIGQFGGGFHFDRSPAPSVTQYYWFQHVSVNGTHSPVLGPSSAKATGRTQELLDALYGNLEIQHLTASLRSSIEEVSALKAAIEEEGAIRRDEVVGLKQADSTITSQITSVGQTVDDRLSNVETRLTSTFDNVSQMMTTEYGVKLTNAGVNPVTGDPIIMVGGYGLVNSGTSVAAGFDVDSFWVGRANDKGIYPFAFQGDTLYLQNIVAQSAVFTGLQTVDGTTIIKDGKISAQYLEAQQINVDELLADYIYTGEISAAGGGFKVSASAASPVSAPNGAGEAVVAAYTSRPGTMAIAGYSYSQYGVFGESEYGDGVRGISQRNDGGKFTTWSYGTNGMKKGAICLENGGKGPHIALSTPSGTDLNIGLPGANVGGFGYVQWCWRDSTKQAVGLAFKYNSTTWKWIA